jgi:hypothetical protein
LVAFDPSGPFLGLTAEGPEPLWPQGTQLREVRADPEEMAALVRIWSADRPAALQGIIWYRLPVPGDRLNWRRATLAAVMAGRAPASQARTELNWAGPGLVQVRLLNEGEADLAPLVRIELRWEGNRLVAGDGLNGFELIEPDVHRVQFHPKAAGGRLPAGRELTAGWLRFDTVKQIDIQAYEF